MERMISYTLHVIERLPCATCQGTGKRARYFDSMVTEWVEVSCDCFLGQVTIVQKVINLKKNKNGTYSPIK